MFLRGTVCGGGVVMVVVVVVVIVGCIYACKA